MFIGFGTYGAVYTRIPFEDELYDQVKDKKEVSKLYLCDATYEDAAGVLTRLNAKLSYDEIERLKPYVLLPIRCGNITTTQDLRCLNHKGSPIYCERRSSTRYIVSENTTRKFVDKQITYALGRRVVTERQNVFERGYTLDDVNVQLQHLIKGIHLLHSYGFVHTDIKLANIVDIDGVWTYADSGDLFHVRDTSTQFDERMFNMAIQNSSIIHYSPYLHWCMETPTLKNYIKDMWLSSIPVRTNVYTELETRLLKKNTLQLDDKEWLSFAESFYRIKTHASSGILVVCDKMYEDATDTVRYMNMLSIHDFYYGPKPEKTKIMMVNDLYGVGFMMWNIINDYLKGTEQQMTKTQLDTIRRMVKDAVRMTSPIV